jgi:two-component system phosphate regulon sensor histidine kinase PhoR
MCIDMGAEGGNHRRVTTDEIPDISLSQIFDALPVGVIVLDPAGRVRVFNQYEERLANRTRERVLGRPFFEEVAPCMNVRELAGVFRDNVAAATIDTRIAFSFPFPHANQPRDVMVKMQSVIVGREPHAILLVEDISAQRAVERLKDTLAHLLVHDFKNPISIITANLDFLRTFVASDRLDGLEALDDSLVATKRLHSMVLNLLDVARLETGTFPLVRSSTDITALLSDLVQGLSAVARGGDVTLVADGGAPLVANVDGGVIRRALGNLVENALRHSPRGSRVVVRAVIDGDYVCISVIDEGPGVPRELRTTIFEKYAQVAPANTASANRGLGLTFVSMVARAHGGDVSVGENTPCGSVFTMRVLGA